MCCVCKASKHILNEEGVVKFLPEKSGIHSTLTWRLRNPEIVPVSSYSARDKNLPQTSLCLTSLWQKGSHGLSELQGWLEKASLSPFSSSLKKAVFQHLH